MPTYMDLQKRIKRSSGRAIRLGSEEVLIADARGRMRPGDFIAEKLQAAMATDGSLALIDSARNGSFRG